MNRVDEILAIIDTGLQTAGDTAYGDDWPGTCWRCGNNPEECGGENAKDLCDECRTYLLDDKPAAVPSSVLVHLDMGRFLEALDGLIEGFHRLPIAIRRRIVANATTTSPPPIRGNLRSQSE